MLVEVPWVLHAKCDGPTRRHPALFERGESAVGGAPVVGTPWTIDFGNARARIDHGQRGKNEEGEGADHGGSPNCLPRPIDHSPGAFIPSGRATSAAGLANARRRRQLVFEQIRGSGFWATDRRLPRDFRLGSVIARWLFVHKILMDQRSCRGAGPGIKSCVLRSHPWE
jgi:hypothetical protein